MKLDDLKEFGLLYVGTPYSKYPGGIETAFRDACFLTGQLLTAGLKVYSPIAHTHPIAIHGGLDPMDYEIWLPFDGAMMAKADAMIVAMMAGWDTSHGIAHEISVFRAAGKPVFTLSVPDLAVGGLA